MLTAAGDRRLRLNLQKQKERVMKKEKPMAASGGKIRVVFSW